MSEQKKISLEVVSVSEMQVENPYPETDWGENAQKVTIDGEIAYLTVRKDGEAVFGLRIMPNGNLIVTSYNTFFTQSVERNLHLDNVRPWKENNEMNQP